MDKDKRYKISILSYVLQIGQTPEEEEEEDYSSGRFDEQKNSVIEDGPYPDVLSLTLRMDHDPGDCRTCKTARQRNPGNPGH